MRRLQENLVVLAGALNAAPGRRLSLAAMCDLRQRVFRMAWRLVGRRG